MFEFHQEIPDYSNFYYQLADVLSGSLFLIVALYAYQLELPLIAAIYALVGLTSMIHIFFPFYWLRLLDYSLAVTCVIICFMLVFYSNFFYPYAMLAAIACGLSLFTYALYQKTRHEWNILYYFWHAGALATSALSITSYVSALSV